MLAIYFSVSVLLSAEGAMGDPVTWLLSAHRMSRVALAMMSCDVIVGMGAVVGNQVSVSAVLSCLVSVIQVW